VELWDAYIQTTKGGKIWVGYGEQAIYNHRKIKWIPTPLGRFNEFGELEYSFSEDPHAKDLPPIENVRCMNVLSDDEVWFCYDYGGLVQIKNDSVENYWDEEWMDDLAVHQDYLLYKRDYIDPESNQ
jgi:hypothetical protein